MAGRNEFLAAAVLFGGFVLVNLATAERSPTVWIDEVMFTDPAINLLIGKGFTSAAWSTQPSDTFFAGNAPLHTLLLVPWIACFGQTVTAVRALNYVLMVAAAGVLWWTLAQRGLIRSAPWRALAVVAILCGDGVTYSYRGGRYDCLGMLWLVCLWSASLAAPSVGRRVILVALGAAIPWTGLQLIPYLGGLSLLYLLAYGRRRLADLAFVWAGVALGAAGLYLLFASQGVWEYLLKSVHELASQHRTLSSRASDAFKALRVDPSLMAMFALMLAAVGWEFSGPRSPGRRTLLASLMFAAAVPMALAFVGKFSRCYAWMAYVPAIVCLFRWYERSSPPRWVQAGFAVGLAVVCLAGFPSRLALVFAEWQARDYRPVVQLIERTVRPDDKLYCEFEAYYAAKAITADVFLTRYQRAMSDAERAAVTVFAARPTAVEQTAEFLGGEWTPVAEYSAEARRGSWQKRLGLGAQLYSLAVYRRTL